MNEPGMKIDLITGTREKQIRDAIVHCLLGDSRWPQDMPRPDYHQAQAIAEIPLDVIREFLEIFDRMLRSQLEATITQLPAIIRKDGL